MTNKEHKISFSSEIKDIWGRKKWKNIFKPVDASGLAVFRMVFGLIMLVEVFRFFKKGWISKNWIDPEYHFPYWPFSFLEPLPGQGMYILFGVLGLLSLMIMLGFLYRISIVSFFLGFSYIFLLEKTRYLNHFYLIILLSLVMIFIPLNRSFSLDRFLRKDKWVPVLPAWNLWLVRFMIGLPYFWGGIAKMNFDWLHGQPMGLWLMDRVNFPLIGQYFRNQKMLLGMSWSGMIVDLLAVPLLLNRRTRVPGIILLICFHLLNSKLFQIGIFPWFMMATLMVFLSADWPRRFTSFLSRGRWGAKLSSEIVGDITPESGKQKVILWCLGLWFLLHTFLPLRHYLIPGNVSWTEEGHRFAWHMKLRDKKGGGIFIIVDENGKEIERIRPKNKLKRWQSRKVLTQPHMVWDFCQLLKKEYADKGQKVKVYARINVELNGRDLSPMVDPKVAISEEPRTVFGNASWILPNDKPFKRTKIDLSFLGL